MWTIYRLSCTHPGCSKVYIGQSNAFKSRLAIHRCRLAGNEKDQRKNSTPVYIHFRAHGGVYAVQILEWAFTKEEAKALENKHMNYYSDDFLLNARLPNPREIVPRPPFPTYDIGSNMHNLMEMIDQTVRHCTPAEIIMLIHGLTNQFCDDEGEEGSTTNKK